MLGPLRCLAADEFAERGEGVVNFGTAPDGMPWVTRVAAPPRGAALLALADKVFSLREPLADYAGTPLYHIANALDDLIRSHYTQDIRVPDGTTYPATILPRPLSSLLGDSMLQRFFVTGNKYAVISNSSVKMATGALPAVRSSTQPFPQNASVSQAKPKDDMPLKNYPLVPPFQPGEACLGFPVSGKSLSVVHMTHDRFGWPSFAFRRQFIQEALSVVVDGQYCLFDHLQPVATFPVSETTRYLSRRREALSRDWRFRAPRQSLAGIMADVAKAVADLHAKNEIHGDLKPANILFNGDGVHLIDSLGLRNGSLSPALSRGWAAPEQILSAEVGWGTDIFPFGLMLLTLVQGVLFGEETTIVVPTGGVNTERHTIFRNPGVFIDPDQGTVAKDHVRSWQSLIERCLRFSLSDRLASADDLLTELTPLLANQSLLGTLEIPLLFGKPAIANVGLAQDVPVWVTEKV